MSYFDRDSGVAKVSLAGIHYPDTTDFFGDAGIIDVTEELARQGWSEDGKRLFMADHYRAAADMVIKWVLGDAKRCNVEIADWFPSKCERQGLLVMLDLGKPVLLRRGRLQQMEAWLRSQ